MELPSLEGPGSNANNLLVWLQQRPQDDLARTAQAIFERLLSNASQPRSSATDSCVKLCGFVQQCAKSKEQPLKEWALSEKTALDLFNFYIEWSEKDQHRSIRLVLDLLALLITKHPDPDAREILKQNLLEIVVSIISRQSTRPLAKSCMNVLNHLVIKYVLTLEDVARVYSLARQDLSGVPSSKLWESFVTELFRWMDLPYVVPVAGKLLVTIFSGLYKESKMPESPEKMTFDVAILHSWLEKALAANPDNLESIKNYVFTPLFKTDRDLSIKLLDDLNSLKPEQQKDGEELGAATLLQLAALEVGKKSGIVDDPSSSGAKQSPDVVVLKRELLERFLVHHSYTVRSFAMSLLTTSPSTTKPYSRIAFELLQKHLRSFHADSDAKFRNETLGHTKNMVKRVLGTMTLLQKELLRLEKKTPKHDVHESNGKPNIGHIGKGAKEISNAGEAWLRETLQFHKEFFVWYLQFLHGELIPTASYQRHVTAMKALVTFLKLGKETPTPGDGHLYGNYDWIRTILDLVMDPFDDVRESATSLLMLYPPAAVDSQIEIGGDLPSTTPLETLKEFCFRATALASRTARADDSNGAARSYGLLCAWSSTLESRLSLLSETLDALESKVARAEKDLGHAVVSEPVHGDFAAIRYMWEVLWQARYSEDELRLLAAPQQRIVAACSRIWDTVSYVLCDDSPEGHLPEEMEEVEGLDTRGLLSYSFRAIHESSNLMRAMIGNLRFNRATGMLLPTPEVFRSAGNLTFTQLSSLRHRGAFSSVSLTFTTCCQFSQDPQVVSTSDEEVLLDIWYKGTLSCIYGQRSTTRRSAGIPSLVAGILASNADRPSFHEVMQKLQEIAQSPAQVTETDGSNLPQVHAFNCLKEVFKSSLLSKKAELYLPECLELATNSLKAEVWAIRNCALLLLRSLMDSLFGTNESKSTMETGWDGKTLRISYTKYPTLPPMLLNLLQSGEKAMELGTLTQSSAAESVFPALDIIRRAGPPESHRDELYKYIARYLGSHQWHVREIAARTLCSFMLNADWLSSIRKLQEESCVSANRLHGTLLTIKFFLERLFEIKNDHLDDDIRSLEVVLGEFRKEAASTCSETWAAYLEIQNLVNVVLPLQHLGEPQYDQMFSRERITTGANFVSKALLKGRLGIQAIQQAATTYDVQALQACLFDALAIDTNTACVMLEAVPDIWGSKKTTGLCAMYLQVCKHTKVPEPRAQALTNLSELMNSSIDQGQMDHLPKDDELVSFRLYLQDDINPALSQAIILASGPIIALQALRNNGQMSFFMFEQKLRAWGKAMADALHVDNTFDMRTAAATSLKSLATAVKGPACAGEAAYLPFLLALYETLIDDDDEIRDVGAQAASSIIGRLLVPVDAADALLSWLQEHFGHTNEFRAYVLCRLVGDPVIAIDIGVQDLLGWTTPKQQFEEALRFDDALFAVEEQNLFIDEVRETERWTDVFKKLGDFEEGDSSIEAFKQWTIQGLERLVEQAATDDGPLGWASQPDVFALCNRILSCGGSLAELFGDDAIMALLEKVQAVGQRSRLHGLLVVRR